MSAMTGAIPVVSSAIPDPVARHVAQRPAVVAFGGGHGLSATLDALRLVTDRITAVVTVADDGGSSGRLREEFGVLPPGDLRMALSALCDDSEWGQTWRDVLQHRFSTEGPLDSHALGNLLIVALWELLGDNVEGLDWVGRLLGARGRVLPMASVPLAIEADVVGDDGSSNVVRGQVAVAKAHGRIEHLRLFPADPPIPDEVTHALERADWVVLGPGSWFSSILPHLVAPRLRSALTRTPARRCLTLNIGSGDEEALGMTAADHLVSFAEHAPGLRIDVVLVDPTEVGDAAALDAAAARLGARVHVSDVRSAQGAAVHDRLRLAAAFGDMFRAAGTTSTGG